jgi:hypothetical protein
VDVAALLAEPNDGHLVAALTNICENAGLDFMVITPPFRCHCKYMPAFLPSDPNTCITTQGPMLDFIAALVVTSRRLPLERTAAIFGPLLANGHAGNRWRNHAPAEEAEGGGGGVKKNVFNGVFRPIGIPGIVDSLNNLLGAHEVADRVLAAWINSEGEEGAIRPSSVAPHVTLLSRFSLDVDVLSAVDIPFSYFIF